MNPIFPSILSSNLFDLKEKLTRFQANGIDHLHLDVMDGHFVSNISFGPAAVSAIRSHFPFHIDSHLMVSNPGRIIPLFIQAGSRWVSIHVEVEEDIKRDLELIKEGGCQTGLVLNPDTAVERLRPYLPLLDYVLLMSVFPGRSGQSFIAETPTRVEAVKRLITEAGVSCLIQVDGGINFSNLKRLQAAGTDLFVVGTFLYNSQNIDDTLRQFLNLLDRSET